MAYRSKVTLVYLLGFALDLLNMFVANIAYPQIALELQASVTQLAWISNAYMLGLTLIIPLSVWLAERLGERRLIIGSLGLFAVFSLLVAQAGSIDTLIGWRLLQGLSGGLLIPIGQALAYRHCPPAERSRLTTWVMLVALLVPALAPAAGGLIVQALSWRWVFYANLPLTLLALLLAVLWLKTEAAVQGRPTGEGRAMLLDLQLLKSPSLRLAMLVYLLVPGVFIGTSLIAVLFLHQLGFGAAQTGALMLPWAVGSGIAIAIGKRGFNRFGPKPLLIIGMLLQSLGLVLLIFIDKPQGLRPMSAYALMGLGGSLCSSCAQTLAFVDVHADRMSHASALWNINRQLSFCLGAAFLSALLAALGAQSPLAFERCFMVAALLTLLPILVVLRFDARKVLALVTSPSPLKETA
ncbi:MFS transporter [Pseudomonas sp. H11T01]|uniref:MFS transporter n=1 Tax=Pseudomonas sp. H11T01 TaxID=3402749 RepID=UPI003AC9F3DC